MDISNRRSTGEVEWCAWPVWHREARLAEELADIARERGQRVVGALLRRRRGAAVAMGGGPAGHGQTSCRSQQRQFTPPSRRASGVRRCGQIPGRADGARAGRDSQRSALGRPLVTPPSAISGSLRQRSTTSSGRRVSRSRCALGMLPLSTPIGLALSSLCVDGDRGVVGRRPRQLLRPHFARSTPSLTEIPCSSEESVTASRDGSTRGPGTARRR